MHAKLPTMKTVNTIASRSAKTPNSFAGADPGFLEWGFICIKGWGVRFADFISFFLNIP